MKISKQNRGITLIALVITIIVMLILVAVTINMAVNGGLFGYAGNATKETRTAKDEEQSWVGIENGLTTGQLIETFTAVKYSKSILDEKGRLKQNAIHIDGNGEKATIPKGFGIVKGCETIDRGLVISDEFDNEGNSIGNEFVWIPVNKDEFFRTSFYDNKTFEEIAISSDETLRESFFTRYKNNDNRLKNYSTYTETIEGNTDINSWNDIVDIVKRSIMNVTSEPYVNAAEWEINQYDQMVASVEKYDGFYIGRYEAGCLSRRNSSSVGEDVYSKRGMYPYVYVSWWGTAGDGAVGLSGKMYENSDSVASTLCYGIQWDATLRFLKDSVSVTSCEDWGNYKYVSFSHTGDYANYKNWTLSWTTNTGEITKNSGTGRLLQTGTSEHNKAKNIYDLSGNAYEWTMEAYDPKDNTGIRRTLRGGNCWDGGSVSNRGYGGGRPT